MSSLDEIEALARVVVNIGFELHRDIGPGLLESAYEALMASLLIKEGYDVQRQVPVQMNYRGVIVDNAFKIDLLVNNCLVEVNRAPFGGPWQTSLDLSSSYASATGSVDEFWRSHIQIRPPAHRQRLLRKDRLAQTSSCLRVNQKRLTNDG